MVGTCRSRGDHARILVGGWNLGRGRRRLRYDLDQLVHCLDRLFEARILQPIALAGLDQIADRDDELRLQQVELFDGPREDLGPVAAGPATGWGAMGQSRMTWSSPALATVRPSGLKATSLT